MGPFTELSLFTGTGGGLLATQHLLRWRTVCYVEWSKYAVDILKARIRDGYLDDAPIWDDAFTFDGKPWAGLVDVVSAGFPCQPFSVAGRGLAENDPRNGWPATIRIIREVRPRIAWLENVPGLLAKPYFGTILGELSEAGYRVRWDCVSAQEVGAPHLRERLWIIAYASGLDGWIPAIAGEQDQTSFSGRDGALQSLANSNSRGWQGPNAQSEIASSKVGTDFARSCDVRDTEHEGHRRIEVPKNAGQEERYICDPQWWEVEPSVGRVADGVANRLDRLAALGNGQVPAVVREAWNILGGPK